MLNTSIKIEQIDVELQKIVKKIIHEDRINIDEGLLLYTKAPISLLGSLANSIREKKNGNKVIASTSMEQSKLYPSRISSQPKLYEVADLVLDNQVPSGDTMFQIGNERSGPASTLAGCFLVNLIAIEAMKKAYSQGVKLPVYYSQNIDGFSNEELYKRYGERIKHL